jgi:hypothetical protein
MEEQGQLATDGILRDESVEAIGIRLDESKQARAPRETEWNKAWNAYNCVSDFSYKAGWQSKVSLPRINTSVRAGAYLIKRGLVGPRDFFTTDGLGGVSKVLAPHVHKITKYHLDQSHFVQNYITALLSGMLSSLVILKVYPKYVDATDYAFDWAGAGRPAMPFKPQSSLGAALLDVEGGPTQRLRKRAYKKLTMCVDPVNAYDYYPDPYNKGLYKIHSMDIDFCEFQAMAVTKKFDPAVVKLITEDYMKLDATLQESARSGQATPSRTNSRRQVHLDEYWGTLLDKNGEVMFKDCYGVRVNEKYMAIAPKPNPCPAGDPFVIAPVIEKPFSTWHQGFVETAVGLQVMLTDLANMIIDSNQYSAIKAFEVDIDQVYDPTEFSGGIFPGKAYKKRGGGFNTAPMIRDINLGGGSPMSIETFMALDREFQGAIGLNEFILPSLGSGRGRRTASEAMQKGQNSSDFFGEMARTQEERIIEPVLNKIYTNVIHYQRDFSDPLLVEILGEEAAAKAAVIMQDPELREFMLSSPLKFMSRGLSTMADRMKELDKVMGFINLVGNVAKGVPQIIQRVNLDKLLSMAIEALNWNPSEILMPEQPIPPMAPPMPQVGAPGAGGSMPGLPPIGGPPTVQPLNAMQGVAGILGPGGAQ